MKMAYYYVCCIFQFFDYTVAYDSPAADLDRVGHEAFSCVCKRYAGIYEYFSVSAFDKAAKTPDSQRFCPKNFYLHSNCPLQIIDSIFNFIHKFISKCIFQLNSITNQNLYNKIKAIHPRKFSFDALLSSFAYLSFIINNFMFFIIFSLTLRIFNYIL